MSTCCRPSESSPPVYRCGRFPDPIQPALGWVCDLLGNACTHLNRASGRSGNLLSAVRSPLCGDRPVLHLRPLPGQAIREAADRLCGDRPPDHCDQQRVQENGAFALHQEAPWPGSFHRIRTRRLGHLRPVARPRRHVREYRHGLVDMVDRTATDGLLRSRRCALGLRAGRSSDGVESLGGGGVMLSAMKSTPSATPWLRTAIVTALFVIGLAILWIVLLGPAALILLSPR